MKTFTVFIVLLFSTFIYAQKTPLESLKEKVFQYNHAERYDLSIKLLTDFISDEKNSTDDKYNAYLIKSDIYKNLFKYQHALKNLEAALQQAKKGSNRVNALQEIKAEKALIYFEMQDFEKAKLLMDELARSGYENLSTKYLIFIYVQEGYFLLKEKNYTEAEKKLNDAVEIAEEDHPEELPIILGKQIELYNTVQNYEKRDQSYKMGIDIAQKNKNLKYEFYLNEVLKNVFNNNNDAKNALIYQKKCDSLFALYNSNSNSSKIEILEQEIKDKNFDDMLGKKQQILIYLFLFSILLITIVLFLLKNYRKYKRQKTTVEKQNQIYQEEIERIKRLAQKDIYVKKEISSFNLTERQLEIIKLIQSGKNNKEIAAELFISENTVKYHLKTIYTILQIKYRNELSNFVVN